MKKYIGHILLTFFVLVIIFIPSKLDEVIEEPIKEYNLKSDIVISVTMSNTNEVKDISLEEYVVGVVASEMPASFEIEALKAQAVAARSYAYFRVLDGSVTNMTNTQLHQVYKDLETLKRIWGAEYNRNLNKVRSAVFSTKGELITYSQSVINATYFSTSNGMTENSEDFWVYEVPYLRSVESNWDIALSPRYKNEKELSLDAFRKTLGITGEIIVSDYKRTTSNRVDTVIINKKKFTGKEIRSFFGLESNDFEIEVNSDNVLIVTKGYGHGVGMSQYGAQGMALEGFAYTDIINHYYKDVKIEKLLN